MKSLFLFLTLLRFADDVFLCFVINKPSRNISEHKMAAFMLRSPDEEIATITTFPCGSDPHSLLNSSLNVFLKVPRSFKNSLL